MDMPMRVLCLIKTMNEEKKPIWFTKIVKILHEPSNKVMSALRTLEDWDCVKSQYEETEKDRVGRCYHLTEFAVMRFKEFANDAEKVMLN